MASAECSSAEAPLVRSGREGDDDDEHAGRGHENDRGPGLDGPRGTPCAILEEP